MLQLLVVKPNSINLIVVEDSFNDIDVITEVVENIENVNIVHIFNSGRGVLEYLDSISTEGMRNFVIFTDLNMSTMDGFELIEALKESDQYKHIPIYVLSSSSRDDDILLSYKLGANFYVQKTLDLEVFEDRLISVFEFLSENCRLA